MFHGYGRGPGGAGRGRGRGKGFGYGRRWGYGMRWEQGGSPYIPPEGMYGGWGEMSTVEEESMLLEYKRYLESELKMVEERLKELRRKKQNG